MKQLLGHALKEGYVDPVIQGAMESALGSSKGPILGSIIDAAHDFKVSLEGIPQFNPTAQDTLPMFFRAQRMAVQSGASNGIGVAMGAYGLYSKFNDKDGTFHDDLRSGDTVRQALAWSGLATDFANIGAGAVSTTVDAKTFQQAKVKAPVGSAPAPVNGAPSTVTAAPTASTAATSPPTQASAPTATAAKATAPAAPAAPATGSVQAATTSATAQAPATPVNAQARGATSAASTAAAQQAEKAAAETAQAAAKAAEQAAKAEKLLKAGRIAGRAAIPLALATMSFDASAGAKAGDRERVAGAIGGTLTGIAGGAAAGALAAGAAGALFGSVVPGWGTLAVGVVAGLGGGIYGAMVGEEKAKEHISGIVGRWIGSDDKFLEAIKQIDPATQKQFAKSGGKLTLDDVHEILKGGKMDSVAHVDTSKDGKLSGAELKAALEKARATFIDNQLTDQLSALEAKGWGNNLGNKDGKLTLDELKASFKEKGIELATLDKDKSGTISGKEITDAIMTAQKAVAASAQESLSNSPRVPAVVAHATNPQMRR
jgi:hypothetical protein